MFALIFILVRKSSTLSWFIWLWCWLQCNKSQFSDELISWEREVSIIDAWPTPVSLGNGQVDILRMGDHLLDRWRKIQMAENRKQEVKETAIPTSKIQLLRTKYSSSQSFKSLGEVVVRVDMIVCVIWWEDPDVHILRNGADGRVQGNTSFYPWSNPSIFHVFFVLFPIISLLFH